jgi:hypothetical protein
VFSAFMPAVFITADGTIVAMITAANVTTVVSTNPAAVVSTNPAAVFPATTAAVVSAPVIASVFGDGDGFAEISRRDMKSVRH